MRRKTYLKAKKVQTFVDVLRMTAYEIQSSRRRESLNLPTTLPVILSAVALPVVLTCDHACFFFLERREKNTPDTFI